MKSNIKDPNSNSLLKELAELDDRELGDLKFKYIKLHMYFSIVISRQQIVFYFQNLRTCC